jgi:hypothetical protein
MNDRPVPSCCDALTLHEFQAHACYNVIVTLVCHKKQLPIYKGEQPQVILRTMA